MSIFEQASYTAGNAQEMQQIGHSMGASIYTLPLTIFLHGDLGAGKTTFTQGLAKKLNIEHAVKSPTYALEQRYGDTMLHIDLFRISQEEAMHHLAASDTFPGIRVVEWAGRLPPHYTYEGSSVTVQCEEAGKNGRSLHISFDDVPVPTDDEIKKWTETVLLTDLIQTHQRVVADASMKIADRLRERATIVRRDALEKAALTHDLLRFVDFKDFGGQQFSQQQISKWQELAKRYGTNHEKAAAAFLKEKGYEGIGTIIRTHGPPRGEGMRPKTTEQKILAYADKRVLHDRVVSLDERFDDFIQRYSNGRESDFNKTWRSMMKSIEQELFGGEPDF